MNTKLECQCGKKFSSVREYGLHLRLNIGNWFLQKGPHINTIKEFEDKQNSYTLTVK